MGGWGELLLAFAAFLASHAVPARPAVKARLKTALGRRGYLVVYILISLAMLTWLIVAAGRAPHVPLAPVAGWQAWVPNLAMPIVCLLIAFGAATPNPLSFGGRRNDRFTPAAPGIAGLTRHPLLWALALWSGAHAVANPDLAHVLLFGGFAGFAIFGTRVIDRRNQRLMGRPAWQRAAAHTSNLPFGALVAGRWRPGGPPPLGRLALGLGLWVLLLLGHRPVIGVSPLPPLF
ncbi:NnrU family protein, required for expression of nitric oxide and nitrite reductases (Nir and Nor) [Rhodovulum sp. P5]|uniref:NnrU family protein n=1 Tax=Rhodovulum sp. P5 TaxID=1564506 RepID=UPI0009C3594F|nr:NnrU family protein [Rhodovulum sp. P5]ARE41126.1 NnrU family protein, required for expression of nitric oxide and nitrite reductases (Nir and Nor) [Rhodovulum sp. P5]